MAENDNKFVKDGNNSGEKNQGSSAILRTQRSSNAATQEDFSLASLKKLSEVRRGQFEDAIEKKGVSKAGSASVVGVGMKKKANFGIGTGNSGPSRGVDRAIPEIYSPLFQVANLNLPRDRMTMNAWNRNFFDTHPIVRNAITLHATYPISKINVKCKHRKVEQFFNDMSDRIDLFDIIAGVAFEFWKMGEAFPYAELDENNGIWRSIVIQNPDYVTVKKSGVSNTSVISLRPDEVLKKIVTSNHPADVKMRSQIPDNIVHHIRKNEPIPLDNFNISHLKMLSSPYDVRGTSIIVSCYKDLMLYDKLRECFSQTTEILTDFGFKKWTEIIDDSLLGKPVSKNEYKIASYNTETDEIEYHYPTDVVLRDYVGKMKHFKGEKIDVCVTPNHRMYIKTTGKKDKKTYWKDYYFTEAKNITDKTYCKFKSTAKYVSEVEPKYVMVADHKIPTELYLEFLGYIISEGCIYVNLENGRYDRSVSINQYTSSKHYLRMREVFEQIAFIFERKASTTIKMHSSGYAIGNPGERWQASISSKELALYLKEQIGIDGNTDSYNKHIPRWVLDLSPRLLKILLNALVAGDGSVMPSKSENGKSIAYRYSTVSKQLADEVYELVYKCGYVPNLSTLEHKYDERANVIEYLVLWSDTSYGEEPIVYGHPDHNGAKVYDEDYDGKVWCVNVPTGAVIVRNNGKISIQGNCKFAQADSLINPITLISVGGSGEGEYHPTDAALEAYRQIFEEAQWDKDFKIITHAAMKVERVGASGAIVDTSNDFNFIRENLYAGLMVPKAVMDTEGSAYASASIGLEVLRTRYITFRNMIEKWLEKKIFAPISQIQGFFEYRNGEKVLIVPEIDWNHINLYDLNDYINALGGYVEKNKVSVHTLYRSLGLNWEEEQRLIREELVRNSIMAKEKGQLDKMSLVELRALDPDEPIVESVGSDDDLLPGQSSNAQATDEESMPELPAGGSGAMPDLSSGEVPGAAMEAPPAQEGAAPALAPEAPPA